MGSSKWNYRVLAYEDHDDVFLQIHEVYYNEKGKADGYTKKGVCVCGENLQALTWTLDSMRKCLDKPILWAGDKFPAEYVK